MPTALDNFIAAVSPAWASRREEARAATLEAQVRNQVDGLRLQTVKRISNTGYGNSGANSMKQSMARYNYRGGSTEDDIGVYSSILAQRSRDQYMGNPIARGALNTHVTHVVGGGLQLKSKPDAKYLGWTEEYTQLWTAQVEREWQLWSETVECSLERQFFFDELQQTAFLSALMSGDCFALLPIVPRTNVEYDLRVHLIEADRVLNPYVFPLTGYLMQVRLLDDGGWISGGIEFGPDGGVRAYHVAKWHPLTRQFVRDIAQWQKIETEKIAPRGQRTGRRNILHLLSVERPEQRRGVPLLAPVIEDLLQMRRYTEAELMAAVVTAMFTVFIKSDTPQSPLGEGIPEAIAAPPTGLEALGADNAYRLGNGTILGLAPDEDIVMADPKRPSSGFQPFIQAICEQIGPALGLPYEVLLQHFSSSYSASRAALLIAWKSWQTRRQWMARRFNQPVFEEFLAEAVAKGRIDAPGFFTDARRHQAYCRANWHGPALGTIEPVKEAQGALMRINGGLSDEEREAAEINGSDPRENLTIHGQMLDLRAKLGITAVLPEKLMPTTETQQETAK